MSERNRRRPSRELALQKSARVAFSTACELCNRKPLRRRLERQRVRETCGVVHRDRRATAPRREAPDRGRAPSLARAWCYASSTRLPENIASRHIAQTPCRAHCPLDSDAGYWGRTHRRPSWRPVTDLRLGRAALLMRSASGSARSHTGPSADVTRTRYSSPDRHLVEAATCPRLRTTGSTCRSPLAAVSRPLLSGAVPMT